MKQVFRVSVLAVLLCAFFCSAEAFAQRGKKKKKPRNFKLEQAIIGTWNAKGQAFYPQVIFRAGNKATLSSMAGNLNGKYVVRGRKLIIRGRLEGEPKSAKKRAFRYKIVSIQGRTLTLKNKEGTSTFTR